MGQDAVSNSPLERKHKRYRQLLDNEINESKSIYNMTGKEHVIISTRAIIGGWLLCGFAMATTLGQPMSTKA